MADSINSSNRIPNGSGVSLPNVGAGDMVRPALFNRLAEGIDRATLQFGSGVRVTKTASSTILSVPKVFGESYPFRAIRVAANGSNFLTFRLGQVFGHFSNEWRDNDSQIRKQPAQYNSGKVATKEEGYHAMGAEIMFDVEGTNYLSTKHIQTGEILQLPYSEGLYYLEVCPWSGLQLTPAAGTSSTRTSQIATWNAYSLSIKGAIKPVIKYATPSTMVAIGNRSKIFSICTIDLYKRIFQCLSSDIFLPSTSTMKPFTVTITQQGAEGLFSVYPGTVNRIVPQMNSAYLDTSPPPDSVPITGEGYVAIKCSYVANTFFPRTAEVIFISGATLDGWEDTLTESYFPVAKINASGSGASKVYSVVQLSNSNLVVNRLKAGANEASWWWDEMG